MKGLPMRLLNALALLLLLLCPSPALATGEEGWTFSYEKGKTYSYQVTTQADFRFQHMSATSGYNGRLGDEIHRLFNIDARLEFRVNDVDGKGNAKVTARFRSFKMTLGYRADKPKEMNGAKPSQATPGELKEVVLEKEGLDKESFKAILPMQGGFVIDDKMKFLSKAFGKELKKMDKFDRGYAKRYKDLLTADWWERFFGCHFLELPKKAKVPGKGSLHLISFLGNNHSMATSILDKKKGCPIEYVSLEHDEANGRIDLGMKFITDIKEGIFNYTQLLTAYVPQVTYSRKQEGHLLYGPYQARIANYSGDASQGDEYLIDIKSVVEFKEKTSGSSGG